jgi:GGDEF domain-containing protein
MSQELPPINTSQVKPLENNRDTEKKVSTFHISPEELATLGKTNPDLASRISRLQERNSVAENALQRKKQKLEEEVSAHQETAETLEWAWATYLKALEDEVTGFLRRGELYKRIDRFIHSRLGLGPEKLTDDEWLEILKNTDNQTALTKDKKYVLMGDVSYLSFANKAGHSAGDDLLKFISAQIKNQGVRGFRHGGDEITAFLEKSPEEIKHDLEKISANIQQDPKIEIFQKYNLKPNVDFGLANINEALTIFNQLTEIPDCPKIIASLDTLKQFENIWIEIADKRSAINKGQVRISELMDWYDNNREIFNVLINYLRKGGYDISNTEIENLLFEEKKQVLIYPNINRNQLRINLINSFIFTRENTTALEELPETEKENSPEKWLKAEKDKLIWDLVKKDIAA